MTVKELFDRAADAKYPDNVSMNIAFKCEMYAALVQRIERNAFDALTLSMEAADLAVAHLAGPGGVCMSSTHALTIVFTESQQLSECVAQTAPSEPVAVSEG
jgi:hypothetical protein